MAWIGWRFKGKMELNKLKEYLDAMIDESYKLVVSGLKRKQQQRLLGRNSK